MEGDGGVWGGRRVWLGSSFWNKTVFCKIISGLGVDFDQTFVITELNWRALP